MKTLLMFGSFISLAIAAFFVWSATVDLAAQYTNPNHDTMVWRYLFATALSFFAALFLALKSFRVKQ